MSEELTPEQLRKKVADALEGLRPFLHSAGNDAFVDSLEDGVASIRLVTKPDGCVSQKAIHRKAIEIKLRNEVTELRDIVIVSPA